MRAAACFEARPTTRRAKAGATTAWASPTFNGDGKDDLATTTVLSPNTPAEANVLEVFTGAAGASVNGPVYYPIVNVPDIPTIVTGDFNGDGKPDLAMVMAKA